jgi:archaellin
MKDKERIGWRGLVILIAFAAVASVVAIHITGGNYL